MLKELRVILSPRCYKKADSPFDQYERGNTAALTQQQVQGLQAFLQSGCGNCHGGPMLSDYQLHVMGVADNAKNAASDAGPMAPTPFAPPACAT